MTRLDQDFIRRAREEIATDREPKMLSYFLETLINEVIRLESQVNQFEKLLNILKREHDLEHL